MSVPKQLIRATVNGNEVEALAAPRLLLCDFIREHLELTGTHVACAIGTCGACTVLLDGRPVRSCLMLAVQAQGSEIRTVEALGTETHLHPVQQAFHENHGLQCGFCTPGLVISVADLLERNPSPSDEQIYETLGGHLCRCTGYLNIVKSVRAAARLLAEKAPPSAGPELAKA